MNKIAFVIPYFGHFNNYFELFLRSCELNKEFCDWLIFTDDITKYNYPPNVKVTNMTWEEMQNLVKKEMGFLVERPYKLCDYKPAYGLVFRQHLIEYEFWGHCDTDMVWGNIKHFLKPEILENYDKIFDLGHCTLYRNSDEMNTLFMHPLNGRDLYKEVYDNSQNLSFDEEYKESINNICLQDGVRMFTKTFAANTYMKTSNFRLIYLNEDKLSYWTEKKSKSFFLWENGSLFRYILRSNKWCREEFMYIHFQSRQMKNRIEIPIETSTFKIIPNVFEALEVKEVTKENIGGIKTKHINLHYFRLRSKNLQIKVRRYFSKK